jgi:hypothetical protein
MPARQFANDSMTPEPISVSRDQYKDEIPSDRPMHDNSTPEHSNAMYTGRQYAPSPMGGTSMPDKGQSPQKSTQDENVTKADRGDES